jgi:hypothetical protein
VKSQDYCGSGGREIRTLWTSWFLRYTKSCAAWLTLNLRRNAPTIRCRLRALVHEAYARLVGQDSLEFESRAHFFTVAAQFMRQILVDCARRIVKEHPLIPENSIERVFRDPEHGQETG